MQIRFDAGGVVSAASHLTAQADDARRLAGAAAGLGAGVVDTALGEALGVLGGVCGDALEVVALDLDLLATTVRAGASGYDAVEQGVSRVAGGGSTTR